MLILLLALAAHASDDPRYQISLLTFGPATHPFMAFGHNAILVRDRAAGTAITYGWGGFHGDDPLLIPHFMSNRLTYWVTVWTLDADMRRYAAQDRSIDEQVLDLTEAETLAVIRAAKEAALPQNREYRYHYYEDNCSTRVRDVLDGALGGRIREATTAPARLSWRGHTERGAAPMPFVSFFLDLALTRELDRPIHEWEELFLPIELERVIGRLDNGRGGPLVLEQRTLLASSRPPMRDDPPERRPLFAALGAALGGALGGLARARPTRAARGSLALGLTLIGALTGFLGSIITALWALTEHTFTWDNESVLLANPLALLLLPIAGGTAWGASWAEKRLRQLILLFAGMALLDGLWALGPWSPQDNSIPMAFFLPLWVVFAALLWRRGDATA